MTGLEIIGQVREQRTQDQCFIKWWRNELDVVDFDLIDRFMNQVRPEEKFDGFILLTMEQMWHLLINLDPDKLLRVKRGEDEVIQWVWSDKDGTEKTRVYPFTPESVMAFFNEDLFA